MINFNSLLELQDCSGSFVLIKDIGQAKSMRRNIFNIIQVLKNKKKTYIFQNQKFEYRVSVEEWTHKEITSAYCNSVTVFGKNLKKRQI